VGKRGEKPLVETATTSLRAPEYSLALANGGAV